MNPLAYIARIAIAACVLGNIAPSAYAQEPNPSAGGRRAIDFGAIQFGVEAGTSLVYLATAKGTDRSPGVGLTGGVFTVIPLKATIGVQPELLYSQRHSKLGVTSGGAQRLVAVNYDYATFAVLARLKFIRSLYITEGPAFHFPLRATVDGRDVKDAMKVDTSLIIGFGGKVGRVLLEARWDSGMRVTRKAFLPGEPFSRNRAITGLVAIPLR